VASCYSPHTKGLSLLFPPFSTHNENTSLLLFWANEQSFLEALSLNDKLQFSVLSKGLSFISLPLVIVRTTVLPSMGIKTPALLPQRLILSPTYPWDAMVSPKKSLLWPSFYTNSNKSNCHASRLTPKLKNLTGLPMSF